MTLSLVLYDAPQILASCIKAALGNDARFRPLTEKEGILFQQPQELEGEDGCGACNRALQCLWHLITPYYNNYWQHNWFVF